MGEIADMMINGSMCQYCGECFDDEPGYPRSCPSCSSDEDDQIDMINNTIKKIEANLAKVKCPKCDKRVHQSGLNQHIAAKH